MSKKSEPRQSVIGTCGHKITRIKREKALLWYCYEGCEYDTKKSHIKFQSRGKSK